jgi:hypothetical protein
MRITSQYRKLTLNGGVIPAFRFVSMTRRFLVDLVWLLSARFYNTLGRPRFLACHTYTKYEFIIRRHEECPVSRRNCHNLANHAVKNIHIVTE